MENYMPAARLALYQLGIEYALISLNFPGYKLIMAVSEYTLPRMQTICLLG